MVELCLRETGEIAARSVARAARSPRGSAAAPVRCRDARAESLEQIGRRRLLGFGGVMDLLAGAFVADDLAEGVAIGVRVLLRLEVTGEVVDQLLGHRELFLRDLRLRRLDLVDRPDFVVEVQLLERDHAVADAECTKILAVAHHELRDAGQAGILERTQQQAVDLLAALLGP